LLLDKPNNNVMVTKFYDIIFQLTQQSSTPNNNPTNKPSTTPNITPNNNTLPETSKIKLLHKILSKEFRFEFKMILTDLYRIYFSLIESYSELEDLFSNIIKIASDKNNVYN